MFELSKLKEFCLDNTRDLILLDDTKKYCLYKFDRGERLEFRMEEMVERMVFNKRLNFPECILRFFLNKEDNSYHILHTMLRNCLLVDKR